MAPSKPVTKDSAKSPPKAGKADNVVKGPSTTPYQLDKVQTLKASKALLKFVASENGKSAKPNLLNDGEDSSDGAQAIWLNLTTKKFITDVRKLKPSGITLPHPIRNTTSTNACLIVKDPQRSFKDLVSTSSLSPTITRVIGVSKLRAKFKTFESRRLLCESHDIFLADDRIIRMLPKLLGKPFYSKTSKVPIPVSFEGANGQSNERLKRELGKALGSTYVHLSASAGTSIRVALSSFTPEQVVDNIHAVVDSLVEKKIPAGWRGVRSLHIKSPNSTALPIWMTPILYEETDILKPEDIEAKALKDAQKEEKRIERKRAKKAKRVKSKALPPVEEKPAATEVAVEKLVEEKITKSTEKLVEREVQVKKKRKGLSDVVEKGLDATVKEAKKLKSKKL